MNERSENRLFQLPHSHLISLGNPREYLHIEIYLILPETTFPGLHFCHWQYMGSSTNFRTVLSESRRRQPIIAAEPETDFNAKWPFKVIQGHLFRYHWRATKGLHYKCAFEGSEDIASEKKRKSPFSTTPLSFDAPSPANPREHPHKTYLAVVPGLHFCRW